MSKTKEKVFEESAEKQGYKYPKDFIREGQVSTTLRAVYNSMEEYASQEVQAFKDELLSKINVAMGGVTNWSMSSRAILEDIVIKSLKE